MTWEAGIRDEIAEMFAQLLDVPSNSAGFRCSRPDLERWQNERATAIHPTEMAAIREHQRRLGLHVVEVPRVSRASKVDPLDVLLFGGDVGLDRGRILREDPDRDGWGSPR